MRVTRTQSPLNRSLLRRVHVLASAAPEKKGRHVVRQERARLWVHHVQTVVIDQHGLLLDPITPALLADLLDDAGPDLPGKRSTVEAAARLTAACAFHIRHDYRSRFARVGSCGPFRCERRSSSFET